MVHSPQSGLGGVSQQKKLAPIGTRGNGPLLKRSPIRTRRETKDAVVFGVLVEEWLFLTSSCFIASKIKRPFSAFVRACAVAMEWGRDKFDLAAARVPRLPPERLPRPLSPGQRVRAVSKWIAVGGTSVASLCSPMAGAFGPARWAAWSLSDFHSRCGSFAWIWFGAAHRRIRSGMEPAKTSLSLFFQASD